jgi:hypothetical protein
MDRVSVLSIGQVDSYQADERPQHFRLGSSPSQTGYDHISGATANTSREYLTASTCCLKKTA